METLTRSASVRDRVNAWRKAGARIALIPTVGTLHKGHMSLVAEAQERADHVIVSIFDDREGFGAAQRDGSTLHSDRELLSKIGTETLFTPPVQEMFPTGRDVSPVVSLKGLDDILEGAHYPGRFSAGLTVLLKLFNIVRPDVALLGERDFQRLVAVRRMVDDLFLSIAVHGCPTFRDGDGLALASVNRDLTPEQRVLAPQLHATLADLAASIDAGERAYEAIEKHGIERLNAAGFATEYLVIRQAADLAPVRSGTRDLVILAAAALEGTRLIDNLRVRLIDRY